MSYFITEKKFRGYCWKNNQIKIYVIYLPEYRSFKRATKMIKINAIATCHDEYRIPAVCSRHVQVRDWALKRTLYTSFFTKDNVKLSNRLLWHNIGGPVITIILSLCRYLPAIKQVKTLINLFIEPFFHFLYIKWYLLLLWIRINI